jgi:serine/threonine protein kinase
MHGAGVLHRDLKPTKIRLRADGTLILDFATSHHIPTGKVRDPTLQVTLGYSPLEAYYSGGKRGAWSDLYSLAGIAYWMITGDRPQEAPARLLHDTMPKLATSHAGEQYSTDFLAALDWALADGRPREASFFVVRCRGAGRRRRRPHTTVPEKQHIRPRPLLYVPSLDVRAELSSCASEKPNSRAISARLQLSSFEVARKKPAMARFLRAPASQIGGRARRSFLESWVRSG